MHFERGNTKLIISNQKEESICIQRVKHHPCDCGCCLFQGGNSVVVPSEFVVLVFVSFIVLKAFSMASSKLVALLYNLGLVFTMYLFLRLSQVWLRISTTAES